MVTARFNMINWLLEMVSTLTIILIGNYKILTILYILFNSVCTPLVIDLSKNIGLIDIFQVYYLGIEKNRRELKEHFLSRMRIFKRTENIQQIQSDMELVELQN